MDAIGLSYPAWSTTFPCRIAPLEDEWLPGFLLRCDEVNHWRSRTTLAYLLSCGKEVFDRTWRTETPNLIVPARLHLDYLAGLLAIPENMLLATTYQAELARCYDMPPHVWHLSPFSLRLCPTCLAEARWIRRTLVLPQIRCCQEHQLVLLNGCQCDTPFRLFSKKKPPFVCPACGRDWAELPRINASIERLMGEQKYLSYYAFFFGEGTPRRMVYALHLIATKILDMKKNDNYLHRIGTQLVRYDFWVHIPLSALVDWLVQCEISPSDIASYNGPQLSEGLDRQIFYFREIREAVVQALQ